MKIPIFYLGQKVIGKNLGWCGDGSSQHPLRRCDVEGEITSIKGMENHVSIYEYEFTWKGGKMMTNGVSHNDDMYQLGLLSPIDSEKKEHKKHQPKFSYEDMRLAFYGGRQDEIDLVISDDGDDEFDMWYKNKFKVNLK